MLLVIALGIALLATLFSALLVIAFRASERDNAVGELITFTGLTGLVGVIWGACESSE